MNAATCRRLVYWLRSHTGAVLRAGQDVVFPVSNPWSEKGNHISILRGSLAPEGAVIKLSGKDIRTFTG